MKRNVLITGVSSGIGFVTARYLADKGYHIIGSVRRTEDGLRLKELIGDKLELLVFDVCDDIAIREAAVSLTEQLGDTGLYALINNAGIAVNGPVEHVSVDAFEHQFDVNVLGLLRVTQAFLPLLGADPKSNIKPGRIVNIGSISGLFTRPFMAPYSASKHAVDAITNAMRLELDVAHGIKVVSVNPGPVKTPIWEKARQEENPYLDTAYGKYLRHRNTAIDQIESIAIDTIEIAKTIHQALEQPKPFIRKIISAKKWLILALAFVLPLGLVDRIFRGQLKKLEEAS